MKTFYVGIKGLIVKNNKILILHTNASNQNRGDYWEVPGGRIDGNESIEQALRRELREELLNIKAIIMHEVVDAYRVAYDIHEDKSLVLIFYKVSADFDGEPQLSDEHVDWKWATKDEALKLVNESCKTAIRNIFES